MTSGRAVCPSAPGGHRRLGLAWLAGGFAFCPCHLPVTLAAAATVFSGTAVGAVVSGHPLVAATVTSLVWAAATWRGASHLRQAARLERAAPARYGSDRTDPS